MLAETTDGRQGGPGGPALRESFETILAEYTAARTTDKLTAGHRLRVVLDGMLRLLTNSTPVTGRPTTKVQGSLGMGNWSSVPWIAFLDSRDTTTVQRGVYCCYLFRADMSGVYVTFNQGVTELRKQHGARKARLLLTSQAEDLRKHCVGLAQAGFTVGDGIDLGATSGTAVDYEYSTVAYKLYEAGAVPDDAEILHDLGVVLEAYDRYLESEYGAPEHVDVPLKNGTEQGEAVTVDPSDLPSQMDSLLAYIHDRGFVFEPWQVAAYVTAIRTKPFVILAGVSGTGKSMLPKLVAEATGAQARLLPVRPDWTDSSEVLGYVDLQGHFRPGPLLQLAKTAEANPQRHYVCVVDEMNLARVEHYFAEVLSCIEDRRACDKGGFRSSRLLSLNLGERGAEWAEQGLPPNLAIVGTVNMDESAHGFSRKVLDRAFTLEFSDIRLSVWSQDNLVHTQPVRWPVGHWYARAVHLAGLGAPTEAEREVVERAIHALTQVNEFLVQAQLQVGYRTRDEVALFALNAQELDSWFVSCEGTTVDPLDLALHMKVLPRIVGGSNAIRSTLLKLLGWACGGTPLDAEEDADTLVGRWVDGGRLPALPDARYPRSAARLCLMWERLTNEGFTSFWL